MIRITPYKGREDQWRVDIRVRLDSGELHRERPKSPAKTLTATRAWAERRERFILQHGPRPRRVSRAQTVSEFVDQWMRDHAEAEGHKASGMASKRRILKQHIIPVIGNLPLDKVDAISIQRLKATLAGKNLATKTINNVLTVLGRMLRSAVEWNLVQTTPPVRLLKRGVAPTMQHYDFAEYECLVAAAHALSWEREAVILLGGDAGLRRSEIIAIEWQDIDFAHGSIVVGRAEALPGIVASPKSGKSRRVPMTRRLAAHLFERRTGKGRIFRREDGKTYSAETVRSAVKLAAKRAGLAKVGVHILRHTFCSHLAMRGAALIEIKELAGHQSVITTQRYMHLSPASADRAILLLDAGHNGGTKSAKA